MPPKVKTSREGILQTAVAIVRERGAQALNARALAGALNCSTQPIFSNFATMEELRLAVIGEADALCREYMQREIAESTLPSYKACGMAYIRFAKEEKELFKLLYMRDRTNETDLGHTEFTDEVIALVHHTTGLSLDEAALFHLSMWAFVHGIATMFATGFLNLEWELVSRMITDSYQGLRKQYGLEE